MESTQENKSIFKEWWFYFVVAVFLFVVYLMLPNNIGGKYTGLDTFATCLSDKGVKMFGTEWCSHCKNQKELFGDSFENIDYVDCDLRKEECQAALVTGYPTWQIDGKNYPGEQTLERLSSLSGCELVIDA